MVKDDNEVPADTLCATLRVQEVTAALCTRRLRLFGHIACSSSILMHKLHHKYDDSLHQIKSILLV